MGDHNCTHRLEDSLHNSAQHMQAGFIKHMKIFGLSDDFLNVHGKDTVMYSRVTNASKTRIDYILSNSGACSYFQYIDMNLGLDHKAVLARYDIAIETLKEVIPKERFFPGWVISKDLEKDEIFLEGMTYIFQHINYESKNSTENLGPSFFWLKCKIAITNLAKEREKEIFMAKNEKLDVLMGFYSSILKDIQNGFDCFQELDEVKSQMNLIYNERSKKKVKDMRCIEIDDPTYDLYKLQKQKKFENQSKIREIKVGETHYRGTPNVVKAIENQMLKEVSPHNDLKFNAPPTAAEEFFLSKLQIVSLNEDEKLELLSPTKPEEIAMILENEVDLDSSPGEDGITYRFIKLFWTSQDYRELYLSYLNFTRENGSTGLLENCGIMTIKNKKAQSVEYEKKRKLTKLNKDTNLGNGKVWTNRFKKVIIPKVLPKTQFNCQADINIIDEIREIRSVNHLLLGDEINGQLDGTILSIDFKDAFRSISLRWFNLVMQYLGVPEQFIDWFWSMYCDLYTVIVINRYKSDRIHIQRGFMEGHPPSMAAFVVSLIPLMGALEENMVGIMTANAKEHKIKLFADDLKLFIKDTEEIEAVYKVICKFEEISGLEMHRDPRRLKCQALPFGKHKDYDAWPEWVTVKSSIKVVGAVFSNNESIDKLNSALVEKCFYNALNKSYGITGTIYQKAFFVNTYLFSKLWYSAQCFKIDEKMLKKIISKSLDFIYAGENEKPVRPLNFRKKTLGGIGLINPIIKARALLIKNVYKDYLEYNDADFVTNLYGYTEDCERVYNCGLATAPVREIYDFLLQEEIYRNGSLIPSRNEKKSFNVKWSLAWKNLNQMRGLTSKEKCFAWKLQQDLLPVGVRKHRKNADRRCLNLLANNQVCVDTQTLEHAFATCSSVLDIFESLSKVLENLLNRSVGLKELITFSFNTRSKKRLVCALWFSVKVLYRIFHEKSHNKRQILYDVIKELDWNLSLNRNIGSKNEVIFLRQVIDSHLV